ncbi:MAG TPA: integrase core domain-containing protein [Acidimicrobiia bacterium]|nr:integrase core domain-containing protein [Acidimicrobiia bacterium]
MRRRRRRSGSDGRFGHTLKGDFLSGRVFDTIEEAQAAVDVWVELHNMERLHQGIRMVPPIAYAWMREGSDSKHGHSHSEVDIPRDIESQLHPFRQLVSSAEGGRIYSMQITSYG